MSEDYFNPDRGKLKASFFGPFYGAYNIIELDLDSYSYPMVSGPNKFYLWILARGPDLAESIKSKLIKKAGALGFKTDELIYVKH